MAESLQTVLNELSEALNETAVTHGIAGMGLRLVPEWIGRVPRYESNPDPFFGVGAGDPNLVSPYAGWKTSSVREAVKVGGLFDRYLGWLWVTFTYALWEDEYRQRLSDALGYLDKDDLNLPVLGDLRHIRHDIVHHRGVASADHTGKCEVLQWFAASEDIQINGDHISEFLGLFPFGEIAALE